MNNRSISIEKIIEFLPIQRSYPFVLSSERRKSVVKNIVDDSRSAKKDDILIIVASENFSNEFLLKDAIHRGQVQNIIMLYDPHLLTYLETLENVPTVLFFPSPRIAMSKLCDLFYPNIPKNWVAVTGTNGKTSVIHFLYQLWAMTERPCAMTGTLGYRTSIALEEPFEEDSYTTPKGHVLKRFLHECASLGVQHVASEISSHALHQSRMGSLRPTVGVWTNFSQDHLDYHKNMNDYWSSKALLTAFLHRESTILLHGNLPYLSDLLILCRIHQLNVFFYGSEEGAVNSSVPFHGSYEILERTFSGQKVRFRIFDTLWEEIIPLLGDFHVENLLAALMLFIFSGGDISKIFYKLSTLSGALGRFSFAGKTPKGGRVYIDYAHTEDALKKVLQSARQITHGKVGVIFGCGGERDELKRAAMGKAAAQCADWIIVTDDNPRTEDPQHIRNMILVGCPHAEDVPSREDAIQKGMEKLDTNDILVICGKGHESYQHIGTKKIPFSDFLCVEKVLQHMEGSLS